MTINFILIYKQEHIDFTNNLILETTHIYIIKIVSLPFVCQI